MHRGEGTVVRRAFSPPTDVPEHSTISLLRVCAFLL
jgi:hypothetical protein